MRLGTSDHTVTLEQVESAVNGLLYRFSESAGGTWSAEFVPETIRVPLGRQGVSI
ncbi:MAG: hypothetical protein OXD30_13500 [Bryobacterales bacterium]|nr:hypothetical protein [Bryobacterales bacterium]